MLTIRPGINSPRLTNAIKKRVEFLMLHEGLSQTETAIFLNIHRLTIVKWNKRYKWTEKQKAKSESLKFDDSLNAFIAFQSIRHPERKKELNEWYNDYKSNI